MELELEHKMPYPGIAECLDSFGATLRRPGDGHFHGINLRVFKCDRVIELWQARFEVRIALGNVGKSKSGELWGGPVLSTFLLQFWDLDIARVIRTWPETQHTLAVFSSAPNRF